MKPIATATAITDQAKITKKDPTPAPAVGDQEVDLPEPDRTTCLRLTSDHGSVLVKGLRQRR
jgi:hypothetical protein